MGWGTEAWQVSQATTRRRCMRRGSIARVAIPNSEAIRPTSILELLNPLALRLTVRLLPCRTLLPHGVDFVSSYNLLREMGFPSTAVAGPLAMYNNDREKALAHFV
ncbi:unnamed protein product [Calypogeia fissa]